MMENDGPSTGTEKRLSLPRRFLGRVAQLPWKRLVLFGVSIGAGVAIALTLVIQFLSWYSDRPTPPKKWPRIELSGNGVRVSLVSEIRDGELLYQFAVRPLDPSLANSFERAASDRSANNFTVLLDDKSGFQLCDVAIEGLTEVLGSTGSVVALSAKGSSRSCPPDKYRDARAWSVSYNFPKLATTASPPASSSQEHTAATSNRGKLGVRAENGASLEGADSLTGFDFGSGHLETRSGRTFLVYREGEKFAANLWDTSARLQYTCKTQSDCLLEDLDNNEAVHARMLR